MSKEWAYSQFDYEVGTSTVVKPGQGDSAVVELPNGKYLALKGMQIRTYVPRTLTSAVKP